MIRWREGHISQVRRTAPACTELVVETDDGPIPALAYPALVGDAEIGDRVLLNTTALSLGLGTGGYALVIAIPDRLPADRSEAGHIVKARYTPHQVTVLAIDEPDSPHHETLRDADDIAGVPVVVADLHSALPAIVAAYRERHPAGRVGYVMTDGGALPLPLSRTVAEMREAGWLAATITVGQSFGGDLEAVTVHSGLLAARHVAEVDVVVVTQGPGNLGTGTRWGFSGVASGEAVNAAAVLQGRPVAALRLSEADPRDRHRGVSHHSLTALGRVATAPCEVAIPRLPGEFGRAVRQACDPLSPPHRLADVDVSGLAELLRDCPIELSTMGRGLAEDTAYFLGCAAAGRHAATLVE